jgi:protein-disulfide isomerase
LKRAWLVLLLLLPIAAHAAPPRRPAPVARDWTQVVVRTADSDRIGNPNAKVKLVEMLSFTCPHCAAFEAEAVPKLLSKYVKPGLVSYEVRVALRDPLDLAATVAARCDGPARFFQLVPILYRTQNDWAAKGFTWLQSNPDLTHISEPDAGRLALKNSGLDTVLARGGMAPAHAAQCMNNVAEQHALATKAQAMWALPGFSGTPGFLIDGQLRDDIHDWLTIDAALAPMVH